MHTWLVPCMSETTHTSVLIYLCCHSNISGLLNGLYVYALCMGNRQKCVRNSDKAYEQGYPGCTMLELPILNSSIVREERMHLGRDNNNNNNNNNNNK